MRAFKIPDGLCSTSFSGKVGGKVEVAVVDAIGLLRGDAEHAADKERDDSRCGDHAAAADAVQGKHGTDRVAVGIHEYRTGRLHQCQISNCGRESKSSELAPLEVAGEEEDVNATQGAAIGIDGDCSSVGIVGS